MLPTGLLGFGCQIDDKIEVKGTNVDDIGNFIKNTSFVPINPAEMTDDQCEWFNENQWNLKWKFVLDGITLTAEEENVTKVEMESLLKTYSYLVQTKPFALYIQKAYEQLNLVSVSSNPTESVSALGLIMAYRGINSDSFRNGELLIRLHNKGGAYTGHIDNRAKLRASLENYSERDIVVEQNWDFHGEVLKDKKMQINIPFGYSAPNYSILVLPKKDQKWPGGKFNVPLTFHELAHTWWNWPHPGGGHDLTYALGAMAGDMINGWPGGTNLTTIKEIPALGNESKMWNKVKNMEEHIGGHLPMGMVFWWYAYFGHYTLNVQYVMNKLKYEVFPVNLPTTGIGALDEEASKRIPSDPFPCVSWKVKYVPIERDASGDQATSQYSALSTFGNSKEEETYEIH